MIRIAVVTGSTRPNRLNPSVARWVYGLARQRRDAHVDLVDIADYGLPLLDEPLPPALGNYAHDHTRRWADTIRSFDGFVFVTPEYNHGTSAALKNAVDYLHAEWAHKAAGFVGYGGSGGVRAVEQLRLVMGNLLVADVTAQVNLSLFSDFESVAEFVEFHPDERHVGELTALLDQVIAWSAALRPLREPTAVVVHS